MSAGRGHPSRSIPVSYKYAKPGQSHVLLKWNRVRWKWATLSGSAERYFQRREHGALRVRHLTGTFAQRY